MTTARKYLVYFVLGRVRFGIRWPNWCPFPKWEHLLFVLFLIVGVIGVISLMGCATSGKPLDVVTDREGHEHRVLHSEFGASVLP